MGGKNPYVVMEDADLADAAQKIVYGAFGHAGQKCIASSLAIVVESVYDELLEEIRRATEAITVGDPMEDDAIIGPVVNKSQCEGILEVIETANEDGRVVLDAGTTSNEVDGFYISTVIVADVDNSSETAQEEIFGPVLAMIKSRDFDEAVRSPTTPITGSPSASPPNFCTTRTSWPPTLSGGWLM